MKILLATDGSNFSKAVIDACRKIIADPENTNFKIVSAVEYPMPAAAEVVMISAEYYNQIEQAGHAQAKIFLEKAAAQLRLLFPGVKLDLTTEIIDDHALRRTVNYFSR